MTALTAVIAVAVALVLPDAVRAQASATVSPGTEVYRIPTEEKVVALTFDDAWIDADLLSILATLKENGVRATFFPTGAGVESSPALAQQIVAEGHELGSHSYTHSKLEAMTSAEVVEQIQLTEQAFASVGLPDPVPLFRTPWGEVNASVLKVLGQEGYANIMWTARGGDTVANRSVAQVIVNIMKDVRPGAIIVMHTRNDITPQALPELIRRLKVKGYTFVTLREALLSPAQRMPRYQETSPWLSYVGEWSKEPSPLESGGSVMATGKVGARMVAAFTGTALELVARTGPECGTLSVSIDGCKAQAVNLYSATEQHRVTVFSTSELTEKGHVAVISCLDAKDSLSTGYSVNLDAVRVTGSLTHAPSPMAMILRTIVLHILGLGGQ